MFKKTKEVINSINENVKHLVDLLESDEIKKLRKDSEELKEIKALLSHIKFKIKDVRIVSNTDTDKQNVVVVYELPRIVLEIDDKGNVNKNDFFYSTNKLNMISIEDMARFQKVVSSRKKQ